jgi:hypothetical protein
MVPRVAVSTAACAVLLSIGALAGAQPQRPPPNDPDMAELAAYRLTVATLEKVAAATRNMMAALESDPRYKQYIAAQKELEALERKADRTDADERRIQALEREIEQAPPEMQGGDAATLSEMERRIEAMPHMSEALAKAGLTAREYAKFTLQMLQSGMLAGMKKAGQLRQLPPGASMENVQFMIDHDREIAALTAMMQGK